MNIQAWNALLVIALLIVLGGGGYILYEDNKRKQAEIAQVEAEERAAEEEAARIEAEVEAARKQAFEDFLNNFLKDVHGKMREYQKARKVVDDLDNPSNLTKAEYARENAKFAEQTVMDLELQMGEVMLSFEQADQEAEKLIAGFDEEEQPGIREKWEDVHGKYVEDFTQFFSMDQDILRAQLTLLQFYAEHSEELFVNLNANRVLFEADELAVEEQELKDNVKELKALRKEIMAEQQSN